MVTAARKRGRPKGRKTNRRIGTVEMTGTQVITMLLSVADEQMAQDAIMVFEDYADRRARSEGLDAMRVRRGLISRVTKQGIRNPDVLALLNEAQDYLFARGASMCGASFLGTYVKEEDEAAGAETEPVRRKKPKSGSPVKLALPGKLGKKLPTLHR